MWFIQVDGLQITASSPGRGVTQGAWGVWAKNGADTLIKNFNADARMVRDIAVQGLQPGTVIVNSKCVAAWWCQGVSWAPKSECYLLV